MAPLRSCKFWLAISTRMKKASQGLFKFRIPFFCKTPWEQDSNEVKLTDLKFISHLYLPQEKVCVRNTIMSQEISSSKATGQANLTSAEVCATLKKLASRHPGGIPPGFVPKAALTGGVQGYGLHN